MGRPNIDLDEEVRKAILRHRLPERFYGSFHATKLRTILLNDSSIPPLCFSSFNESKAASCILHTDPSFRNRLDWVSVYCESHCPLEFFDSFAFPPATNGFHFPLPAYLIISHCRDQSLPTVEHILFSLSICSHYRPLPTFPLSIHYPPPRD